MTGVAIEQMLELCCVELRQVKAHLKSLFAHPSVAISAAAFLDGLLGPERRKTGGMRAEANGDLGPWRQQAVRFFFGVRASFCGPTHSLALWSPSKGQTTHD